MSNLDRRTDMRLHRPLASPGPSSASAPTSRRGLLGVLLVAQLMVILDISAVNVALPDMASDLNISGGDIGWTITSYSLIFGSLLLLGGRAADLLGRRRVFLAGLTVFTVSSFASALALSGSMLFAARAGQGLGAAMLSPAALSIITTAFQGKERAKALGPWGAVGGAGAAIGVLLGGVLTEVADWRAIFYINLPVGLALAVAATKVVPADPARPRWRGLDLRGATLATFSLASVMYAISQAGSAGWASAQTLGLGLAGLAGLAAFVALERGTNQPLLRVQRLADRAVGGGFLLMLIASAVLFGMFLLSSLYLQNVLGTGPLQTGLAFLPVAIVTGVGAHVGSQLVSRMGVRVPMAGGFAATALGMLLLAGVDRDSSYVSSVLPGMLIAGLGLGVVLVGVAVSVLTGARDEEAGMLSGLNTTGHEVGGSFGVAVLVSIATAATGTGSSPIGTSGIADAFLAAGILAGVGSLVALIVLPSARSFLPKLGLAPASMSIH
ncbi:MAG TPA: MFS transporter [Chloroflexota bacterium]|nr:MFS transporter [Chloroflexota bacterium]